MLAKLIATNSKQRKYKLKVLKQHSPIKTQLCGNDQIKGMVSSLKLMASDLVKFCGESGLEARK